MRDVDEEIWGKIQSINWTIAVVHPSEKQRSALREVIRLAYPRSTIIGASPSSFNQAVDIVFIDVNHVYRMPRCLAQVWLATDESYCRAGIRSGVADYLVLPADADEIQEAVFRAGVLALKHADTAEFIKLDRKNTVAWRNVEYLQASRNYCFGYLATGEQVVFDRGMKKVLEELPASCWCRSHYSYAVNLMHLDHVAFVDGECHMRGGTVIPMSEKQKEPLKATLASFLITD